MAGCPTCLKEISIKRLDVCVSLHQCQGNSGHGGHRCTHNFVAEREIQKLGVKLTQHSSQIKAVNSEAKPIIGMTIVELKVGSWSGQCGLMAIPLDDFDVILGNEFLVAVMPHLGGLLIAYVDNPSFVKGVYDASTASEKKK